MLGKLGVFTVIGVVFWPLAVLVTGILLHVLYFGRVLPAITLVPAGILTAVSILLMIGNWFGWGTMKYMWPLFLLAVAIGLYEYYVFGFVRNRAVWTAAMGLAGISVLLFLMTLLWTWGVYLIALLLIGFGIWLVMRRPRRLR
nr:hypothetical protein [Cohnella sp. REN36]